MTRWAAQQPENGDILVTCGHAADHWALLEPRRVAVTRFGFVSARWIVLCSGCYVAAEGDFTKPPLTNVAEWTGGRQNIIQEPSS